MSDMKILRNGGDGEYRVIMEGSGNEDINRSELDMSEWTIRYEWENINSQG